MWEVIVGNIGTVYSGDDELEARCEWETYVAVSKRGHGRGGNETVMLMCDGEIDTWYYPEPEGM